MCDSALASHSGRLRVRARTRGALSPAPTSAALWPTLLLAWPMTGTGSPRHNAAQYGSPWRSSAACAAAGSGARASSVGSSTAQSGASSGSAPPDHAAPCGSAPGGAHSPTSRVYGAHKHAAPARLASCEASSGEKRRAAASSVRSARRLGSHRMSTASAVRGSGRRGSPAASAARTARSAGRAHGWPSSGRSARRCVSRVSTAAARCSERRASSGRSHSRCSAARTRWCWARTSVAASSSAATRAGFPSGLGSACSRTLSSAGSNAAMALSRMVLYSAARGRRRQATVATSPLAPLVVEAWCCSRATSHAAMDSCW
mmetsp:Transcript_9916/g.25226  ORF Transcript_9916/g.25226 Transcript_9916/m.25226 type:complete len:317 (-) Transcript_9916:595-1545(-)